MKDGCSINSASPSKGGDVKARLYQAVFWSLIASVSVLFVVGCAVRALRALGIRWWWFIPLLIYSTALAENFITADVYPRVALVNPYKRETFRFRWQIPPHPDNRWYALAYTCGKENHSSQGEVEGDKHPKTTERFVELTVVGDCEFMACVVRVIDGKPETICDYAYVRTRGDEP